MKPLLFLLVVSAVAFAQVESDGVLSFIEDLPAPGGDEGIYRQTPFVEVIQTELLEQCQDEGFDPDTCPVFEWSVPFLPATAATAAEDRIAGEWFRLETRAYWRSQLEVGGVPSLIACTLGAVDLYWLFYSGELFFPASEFCDDKPITLFSECFFSCDLPPLVCPNSRPDCLTCFEEGMVRAWEHVTTVYYPEYQEAVATEVIAPLLAAGALNWSDDPLLLRGSILAPITDPLNQPLWVQDVAETLVQQGLNIDPRAATYFTQTAALDVGCQTALLAGTTFGLYKLPTETFDPEAPGLHELEELKRRMADRESAGDTWQRTPLLFGDRTALSPKYQKTNLPLANFFGERSKFGTATPTGHACLGQTTFLQLFQKFEVVTPTYRSVQRLTACIVGVTLVPIIPQPLVFSEPRWHTDWRSVPEGYAIPNVEGEPRRVFEN